MHARTYARTLKQYVQTILKALKIVHVKRQSISGILFTSHSLSVSVCLSFDTNLYVLCTAKASPFNKLTALHHEVHCVKHGAVKSTSNNSNSNSPLNRVLKLVQNAPKNKCMFAYINIMYVHGAICNV